MDLALNDLQRLICHKTQTNKQTNKIYWIHMICKYVLLITFLNEPKLILWYTVKWFQVLLCITNNSSKYQLFVYTQLNNPTVLFQTIQFSISHLFALSLNVKEFCLTLATTESQSGPGSDGNEDPIPRSSSITGVSPLDGFCQYQETRCPFAEKLSVYSTAPADWTDETSEETDNKLDTKHLFFNSQTFLAHKIFFKQTRLDNLSLWYIFPQAMPRKIVKMGVCSE